MNAVTRLLPCEVSVRRQQFGVVDEHSPDGVGSEQSSSGNATSRERERLTETHADQQLQRRRRHDAHERAAGTHERAAEVHEDAAATFARHDRLESAAREQALADKERALAKRAHEAADEELQEGRE